MQLMLKARGFSTGALAALLPTARRSLLQVFCSAKLASARAALTFRCHQLTDGVAVTTFIDISIACCCI